MPELRELLGRLGFEDVRTLLNTGNVVFLSEQRPVEVEVLLEAEAAGQLDLRTDFMVRSAEEWADVVAHNPFPDEARNDPSHLVVMFLKSAPEASAVEALRTAIAGREVVRARGRQLYVTYPDGIGRSKLTNAVIEKKLATRGTGRNWNTVLKLGELARGGGGSGR